MIDFGDTPELVDPVLLGAFEGWNDAGDASTNVIAHLVEEWSARLVGEVDPEDYYDFQVNRPHVRLIDGETREITWPTTRLYSCRPPGADHDLVLMQGIEPNMRWRGFCEEILEGLHELGVTRVVTLGSLLADTPHTRPVPVTGTASDEATVKAFHLQRSRYEGPTGIVGVFQDACARAGLSSVSFWAAVPHYASQTPSPKVTAALLRKVEDLLDLAVPLDELDAAAREWEAQVDELVREDSDVEDYVRQLEERDDETADLTASMGETSGEALAREFERYLRRRGNEPGAS